MRTVLRSGGQLERFKVGAFQRPWEQPVVRATLLLASGVLIAYWEMLRVSGS